MKGPMRLLISVFSIVAAVQPHAKKGNTYTRAEEEEEGEGEKKKECYDGEKNLIVVLQP